MPLSDRCKWVCSDDIKNDCIGVGFNAYLHKGVSYIKISECLQLALLEVHHIAIGGVKYCGASV